MVVVDVECSIITIPTFVKYRQNTTKYEYSLYLLILVFSLL